MSSEVKIVLSRTIPGAADVLIVPVGADLRPAALVGDALVGLQAVITTLAPLEGFSGKAYSAMAAAVPTGEGVRYVVLLGVGDGKVEKLDWLRLGGLAIGRLPKASKEATFVAETAAGPLTPEATADFCLGARLRAYGFERYKTRRKDDEPKARRIALTVVTDEESAVKAANKARNAVGDGVIMARDLVNEPANVLTPIEFVKRASELEDLGVTVEILDEKAMKKLGMRALLAVGRGSAQESRLLVLRWNGGKDDGKPLVVVGKGVTFDSGGISIKPAASMEDMKGDMGGGACVVGLMRALAGRKAKANVVGLVGLVENMPDADAQRPGDIVTSLSGQTIEIINTDAEGRLVLADVLWYAQDRFKPSFIIDLATLTGAIIVALGQGYAGLFSNSDELAARLAEAGTATGEKVWRLPLAPDYDKLIDSRFADVKNSGGRQAGSITAAQFLQRFVNDVPWAHLDIAGTAFGAPASDINRSWGSGWGVRLLDAYVRANHEGSSPSA